MGIKKVIYEQVRYEGTFSKTQYNFIKTTLKRTLISDSLNLKRSIELNEEDSHRIKNAKICYEASCKAYEAFTGEEPEKVIEEYENEKILKRGF